VNKNRRGKNGNSSTWREKEKKKKKTRRGKEKNEIPLLPLLHQKVSAWGKGRTKLWGGGHPELCCRIVTKGPFEQFKAWAVSRKKKKGE